MTRRNRISREQIVDTALQLARDGGINNLSMRKVAAELKVEAMSLYHHVPSKAALLTGMADRALSQMPEPTVGLPWDQQVIEMMVATFRVGTDNPAVVEVLASPPPVDATPPPPGAAASQRLIGRVLDLLREAGLPVRQQMRLYRGVVGLVIGFIVTTDGVQVVSRTGAASSDADANGWLSAREPRPQSDDPAHDLSLNLRHLLDGVLRDSAYRDHAAQPAAGSRSTGQPR